METKKPLSELDFSLALKDAHEAANSSLRITSANSSVPPQYSRSEITYNANGSATLAKFFSADQPEITEVRTSSNELNSLNNTYFNLYVPSNNRQFYVWYNSSGTGVDPAVSGAQGIEIPIQNNDSSDIVAFATERVLSKFVHFNVRRNKNVLRIQNTQYGITTNSTDNNTGFEITTIQEGSEKLIKSITIPYDGNVRYIFNEQERKFVAESVASLGTINIVSDADTGDNIAISRHQNFVNLTKEADFVDTDLSTSAYTEVFSYTALQDLRFRIAKVKADTFGAFRVKVDGAIQDYYRTSPTDRNCIFNFIEDLDLQESSVLTVEFKPERLRISNYNFFLRLEGYRA